MKIVSKGLFKSIKEFKLIQDIKLGNGSFGIVKLAVHKSTNKLYAIKMIELKSIPSEVQLKLIQRQIKLHSQIVHPHIIMLWDTIIDNNCIYMILEYAEHGNLFYYQNTKNIFKEPEAFVFFSQTVRAIDHLHRSDIIHRDLKPENLLLDQYHNIKLCDFGWCAENIENKRSTFCGTYQYMSPEMLFNTSYDYRIDIWALGVLLYEMAHGCAPFKGGSINEVKDKILQGSYEINQHLSQELKDLIATIIKFDPNQRITIKQVLNSEWFQLMQNVINKYTQQQQKYDPNQFHNIISSIPPERYLIKYNKRQYNSKLQSSDNTAVGKSYQNVLKKSNNLNGSRSQTKNMSFNFAINNFAYIKNSYKPHFNSPVQMGVEKKKKDDKRCRTLADEQILNLMNSHSPNLKKTVKTKIKEGLTSVKEQQPIRQQSNHNFKERVRRSQESEAERSPFHGFEGENNEFSGGTPSKVSSILKQKSIRDKLSSAVSMKSIHKVRTKDRGNITNTSGLNF